MGTTKRVGCFPLHAHRRMLEDVGRRVDPGAAWNVLHVEETEMKMVTSFHHLRERISHLTNDAWNSITTTTDHMRSTTLKFRRRTSGEPNSTSPQPCNRPH